GEMTVRVGSHWAWCEVVVRDKASENVGHHTRSPSKRIARPKVTRDHGIDMFLGYEFRNLENERARAIYDPEARKILINTAAPTVQLYVDGRGYFRDSARLLLAELFMDVIADELARHVVQRSGKYDEVEAFHATKQDIV